MVICDSITVRKFSLQKIKTMASANISDFLSSFKGEVARSANFEVFIQGMNTAPFRCEATELPSRNFATVDQKTYGPVEAFPVQTFYDKIVLNFICSDDMSEKTFFDNWMDKISSSKGPTGSGANSVRFDFEYKDNYQKLITIKQFDVTGKMSYGVNLLHAFPVSINSLSLRWDNLNTIHKLPVTISYRYYSLI